MHIKRVVLLFIFFTQIGFAEEQAGGIHLAEKVAASNDWLINKGQENPLLKPFTWITSRTMSVTLFPLCTAIDMAVLAAKQARETPYVILNKGSSEHLLEYRKNAEQFKSNFLGLVTAPIGILSPDLVTQHFVPCHTQEFELIPYGKLYSSKVHMVHPDSISDVQTIVKEARRAGKTISTLGKTMSQGKQAISNKNWNIVIDTSRLNRIKIDPKLKIATVEAGASWGELQREANQHGLAVQVMQASNIFSIGGSISVNCHGWDYKAGNLRNTIHALTLVDSNGNVLTITPEDTLFDYVVGGYGGFGIIVEASISLTDNVTMIENGVEVNPSEYVSYFEENILHNQNIDMHLYRLSLEPKHLFQTGVAVNYQRMSDEPIISNLVDEPENGYRTDRIKMHTVRRLSWLRNFAWKVEKKNALAPILATRNEFMRPPINPVFNYSQIDTEWLQEYFVKGEDLADFLQFLGEILQNNRVALFNASVRFVKLDSSTKLSYTPDGDRFAVVLFFNQKLSPKEIQKTKRWVREVIDYLIAHEGSFYLPYQHFASLEQFRACYPNWNSVNSYKASVDADALFDNGLYSDYLTCEVTQDSLFRKVFDRVHGQRSEVSDFLNNIFMQLKEEKFFNLVDYILDNPHLNDEQIYTYLYNRIKQAKPNAFSHLHKTLQSLTCLKSDLGDQTADLVNRKNVNGYLEIGYTGRMIRPLKKQMILNGPLYVMNDKEGLSDYIEAGFPLPYDQFVPLNNYAPISEAAIPTASLDLVCLYIGLHHAPLEKLDPFIASIKRVLRPGGTFVLMDHDAHSQELQNFVNVVHSIFNVATGVEPKLNQQEVRNFQSLKYWINLLEEHGMILCEKEPLVRKGDSTLNSLIRFDKPIELNFTTIVESLRANPVYTRPQIQTYLTAPEWQNVRAAQHYAAFVENEHAHHYPYFSEIGGFWKVYVQAIRAAQKKSSFLDVVLSEYNLMNLFVGTSMTLEYGTKGLLAAPFTLMDKLFKRKIRYLKNTPSDQERLRSLKEYGNYIENTPFYQYPYFKDIKSYWKTYVKKNNTIGSWIKGAFIGTGMTLEYTLKGLVSFPMSYLYGSEGMKEAMTTHLIVKDEDNLIETIDSNIVVISTDPEHSLKHVEIPRYMQFTEIMLKIAQYPSIVSVNIAGNDKIQMDVKNARHVMQNYPGARILYEIPVPTDTQNTYVALEVDVDQLNEVIRRLDNDHVEILFIHDY